jgi:hypothetical protein
MYINAVTNSVMLYLHDFYNIIFKIKDKLCTASGSASEKFWVRTCMGFSDYGVVKMVCKSESASSALTPTFALSDKMKTRYEFW